MTINNTFAENANRFKNTINTDTYSLDNENERQNEDLQIYSGLKNKDVEWTNEYFDVVPDQNLYTLDDYPIFAVRMRAKGIDYIIDMYCKKYHFEATVLRYRLTNNHYMLYIDDSEQMFITQKDALLKYMDFSNCNDNELKGMAIAIVNNEDRLVHTLPIIYGKLEGKKKLLLLDPYFSSFGCINEQSGAIRMAKFFLQEYKDLECYCHGETFQADHHSCGIIACDFLKNCLKKKAKVAKQIINSVTERIKIGDERTGYFFINNYRLPTILSRFSQLNHKKPLRQSISEIDNEDEKQKRKSWFNTHFNTLKYRKNPEPYSPEDSIIPPAEQIPIVKQINTALIEKGHKYAGIIMQGIGEVEGYDPKYWLSMIREQSEENIIKKLIRRVKRFVVRLK